MYMSNHWDGSADTVGSGLMAIKDICAPSDRAHQGANGLKG